MGMKCKVQANRTTAMMARILVLRVQLEIYKMEFSSTKQVILFKGMDTPDKYVPWHLSPKR